MSTQRWPGEDDGVFVSAAEFTTGAIVHMVPDWPVIVLLLLAAAVYAACWFIIGWIEGNRPVEMPGGETVFDHREPTGG